MAGNYLRLALALLVLLAAAQLAAASRRGPKGKGPRPCKGRGRGKRAKEVEGAMPAVFQELSPLLTALEKAGNLSIRANPNGAIMRGYYATRGRYPWMADIRHPQGAHWCGGALIHPRIVLTAAHCFLNTDGTRKPTWDPQVRIGQWAQMSEPATAYETRQTLTTFVHPKYNPGDFAAGHDATLLLLDAPVASRAPIRLPPFVPKPKLPATVGSTVYALGWGANGEEGTAGTDILREAGLKLQTLATCQQFNPPADYGDFNSNTNMCAGNPPYLEDVCSGDSGGPLFSKGRTAAADVLLGLTSYGLPCDTKRTAGEPGVYTDVAAIRPWVDAAVACLLDPAKCSDRVPGDPLVTGFNNVTFTPPGAKPGQMLDLLAATGPQAFELKGQLSYGPRLGTTALSYLGLTWGEASQVYLSKGQLTGAIGFKPVKPGASAALAGGRMTVARQVNGQPRRVDITKPGMTFTAVQPYLAATKAYADWVDLTVTLTGPIPAGLSGLLGSTLPSPQPAVGLRRDGASGTAKAEFTGRA